MPVTLHKLLVHGADIVRFHHLPFGQLSEEALEARHKDCRRFREHNTRKISRVATNTDLFRMLLVTSDPVVNSYRSTATAQKKRSILHPDVRALLKCPTSETPVAIGLSSVVNRVSISDDNDSDFLVSDDELEYASISDDSE